MFIKSRLGIYLSPKKASIIEAKGKEIINKHSLVFGEKEPGLEPENEIIKKVTSFNEALREGKIKAKECFIGLSSEDLIIRSFIIPSLPPKEIPSAINFEVKRYIPFPTEELISDFQYRSDRLTKKIEVIFTGIKKELFKQYNNIFEQLGFKVLGLEPGVFSILRLLKQRKKIDKKGSFGIIDVNGEEVNFTIILKDFPFFTYQIKIPALKKEEIPFRFRSGVRVSLDYFRCQFPGRNIDKILLLAEPSLIPLAEGLEEETGLPLEVLEPKEFIGKDIELNISEIKALSSVFRSLYPKIISINLYKSEVLIEKAVEVAPPRIAFTSITLKVILRPLIIVLFIVFFAFFLAQQRSLPLKRELKDRQMRISSLKIIPTFNTLSDLQDIKMNYQKKLSNIDEETRGLKLKVIPLLDIIPRLIPEGLWLEDLSLTEEGLRLRGYAYFEDEKKEFGTVYRFLSSLKETDIFTQRFKDIRLNSVSRTKKGKFSLTSFEISLR